MNRVKIVPVFLAATLCPVLMAGEKKAPQGRGEDDSAVITAVVVAPEQVRQMFGSDFDNNFTVLDVTISPKDGKAVAVRLDDFILRSESSGAHSGPLAAGQIAGGG